MWFRKKEPKETMHKLDPDAMSLFQNLLNAVAANSFPRAAPIFATAPAYPAYRAVPESPEEIEARNKENAEVDAFLANMEPQIKVQAEALVKEEVREMLLMGGNRQRILELLRLGKVPKIVRKKEGRRDPLYLQWGDGIIEPIEEMQILG